MAAESYPPSLPRRRLLTAAGAAAAVLGLPASAATATLDAKLLHLCAQHERVADQSEALAAPYYDVIGGEPPHVRAEIAHLVRLGWSYRRRIAQHPARTAAGMVAKARVAIRYCTLSFDGTMDPDRDDAVTYGLCQDVLRLHNAGAA